MGGQAPGLGWSQAFNAPAQRAFTLWRVAHVHLAPTPPVEGGPLVASTILADGVPVLTHELAELVRQARDHYTALRPASSSEDIAPLGSVEERLHEVAGEAETIGTWQAVSDVDPERVATLANRLEPMVETVRTEVKAALEPLGGFQETRTPAGFGPVRRVRFDGIPPTELDTSRSRIGLFRSLFAFRLRF